MVITTFYALLQLTTFVCTVALTTFVWTIASFRPVFTMSVTLIATIRLYKTCYELAL